MGEEKAVFITSAVIFAFGVPSGLSFGVLSDAKLFGMTFFDHVDNIASNYLLPVGGMLTAIFVGWVWGTKSAEEEIEKHECGNKYLKKREDDNQEAIIRRYDEYIKKTKLVLNFYSSRSYFHEIDGNQKIQVITGKIEQILRV